MMAENRAPLGKVILHQVPMLIWLVVLWMLLWGSFTWLTLLTGAIVALLVTRVFYLPPLALSGRFNPWWALVFAIHFTADVFRASIQVAWIAIDPRTTPSSSVVAVQLRSRSDLIMTLVSIAISLVPGSLVVEADRLRAVLYVHVLATETLDDVAVARATVLTVERRIVRALGSREEYDLIEREEAKKK
ncbi:MAG TPA: Na+/H+ antiporter subunit E [Homoserinimonas sp.]|nr:Na+/H+ antiporter subunit E [Homoserinimonas sp.]